VILRRKFSATAFWDEATMERATAIVYIGELCRYLVNSPPHPKERAHTIRTGFGNGLRPDVWQAFLDRFSIPHLCEFYGSTEGNVSMLNYDGTVGAVGRVPDYLEWLLPSRVIRFDVESEMPVRGADGLCIECAPDEVGETVGGISTRPGRGFEGYSNKADSDKKILRDVFKRGDAWFRTGDLMRRDAHGYFYFVDRVGDTFRWKGENVSTSEVEQVLMDAPGVAEAIVYGIPVPGQEGKAGMAALVIEGKFDPKTFADHINGKLPAYAQPVFLRMIEAAETTGTFKYRKSDLVADGFDPERVGASLYVRGGKSGYQKLTAAARTAILNGEGRL
jgi:fatty-acyl-CoA synthase